VKLSNTQARRLAIHCTGLSRTPTGPCGSADLLKLIKELGYVQLDPLNIVARAHDHILWSRNNQYRPPMLNRLMAEDRLLFEHFSHDACVLPMDTLPYWRHQFSRMAQKMYPKRSCARSAVQKEHAELLKRILNEGPLRSNDFKSVTKKKPAAWTKPLHKQGLDYLWLNGELAVTKRVNFSKYYDLSERVYPQALAEAVINDAERIDWLTSNAFKRLGFGTKGDVMRFWESCSLDETKQWCETHANQLINVTVESADGEHFSCQAHQSLKAVLKGLPKPTTRLRIINPFDPLVRDRKRVKHLFGFDYRIEIYTPAEKRTYGYYVYPMLECDSFVGRIEVRHERKANEIIVDNLWTESGVKFGRGRMVRLESELERLRRFCGADSVRWSV